MSTPLRVRYQKINRLADDLLSRHGIEIAPVPVDEVAEAHGIAISYKTLDDDLAGFLLRDERRKVIGVNAAHSLQRQRFTIAHELGHALLHAGEPLHIDRDFRVNFRSPASTTATHVEEIEANTFAAALLMPSRMLRQDLEASDIDIEDDEQVTRLARTYGVSRMAMTYRLINLLPHI